MFSTRATSSTLGHRLDPAHYSPEAVALDDALALLANARPIRQMVNPDRKITNGVRGPHLASSEFKLVRLQDCRDWVVDFTECITIGEAQFRENARCTLQADDVVVAIGGYLGNAAVVQTSHTAVIGQHSALLPFGHVTPHDPRYLVAYLNSRHGAIQFSRWSRGTVQAGLNLEDIEEIAIPCPHKEAQAYIGNKVRQAEALRAEGGRLHETLRELMLALIERRISEHDVLVSAENGHLSHRVSDSPAPSIVTGPVRGAKFSTVDSSDVLSRLNAEAYAPQHLFVQSVLQASGLQLGRLEEAVSKPINNSIRDVSNQLDSPTASVPMFRPADIKDGWVSLATAPKLPKAFEETHAKARVYPGDLVLGIAGTVGAVGRVPEIVTHGNINGSSARLSPHEPIRAWLQLYLRSPYGQSALMRWAVGAVQKHLNLEDLPGVQVVLPHREAIGAFFEQRLLRVERLLSNSRWLVDAARLLVEALIERKVSEQDLIAAHKDPAADSALLTRLTVAGLDAPDADPLFPDLDRLDELLSETGTPQ